METKITTFFSKKTNNKVIEVEEFSTSFVYRLYPESDNYKSFKHLRSSNEISKAQGRRLLAALKGKSYLYFDGDL
jgi:hypothetical protein